MTITGAPVLMYHEVTSPARVDALARKIQRGYICTDVEFEGQMRFLKEHDFQSISLARLVDSITNGEALPSRSIVITFDDGFEGNFTHALPILRKYGLAATFFVVSNKMGDPSMMTWQQLGALMESGCEVHSHTANHPLLSTLGSAETRGELAESRQAIEQRLATRCECLSLPNGDSNAYLNEHARACGYKAVCGSRFGFNDQPDTDVFRLDRIAIKAGISLGQFRDIVCRKPALVRRMHARAALQSTVSAVLGKRRYDRLYNAIHRVDEQDRRRLP